MNTLPELAVLPWTAMARLLLKRFSRERWCISSRSGSNSTLWASSSSTLRPSTLRTSSMLGHPLSRHGVGALMLHHEPLYVKRSRLKIRKTFVTRMRAPYRTFDLGRNRAKYRAKGHIRCPRYVLIFGEGWGGAGVGGLSLGNLTWGPLRSPPVS